MSYGMVEVVGVRLLIGCGVIVCVVGFVWLKLCVVWVLLCCDGIFFVGICCFC